MHTNRGIVFLLTRQVLRAQHSPGCRQGSNAWLELVMLDGGFIQRTATLDGTPLQGRQVVSLIRLNTGTEALPHKLSQVCSHGKEVPGSTSMKRAQPLL